MVLLVKNQHKRFFKSGLFYFLLTLLHFTLERAKPKKIIAIYASFELLHELRITQGPLLMTGSFIKDTSPFLFIPLLFLSGCLSMSEKEKTQNLIAPPSLSKSTESGFDSGIFSQGLFPKEAWWEDFNSPILTALIEESFQQSPSLKSVESRIDQAKQKVTMTKSKLFPTLFFNADDNWRYLSENGFTHLLNPDLSLKGYQVDLSLAFQYEFDFWGKYRNIFRSALGELKVKEAEFAEAKLILATSLEN